MTKKELEEQLMKMPELEEHEIAKMTEQEKFENGYLPQEEKEKLYLDNSIYMELIGELATQITEMNYGADTFKNVKEGSYKFTDEAQEYHNEMYDEYETLFNNLGNIYSKNKHEL